MLTISHGWIRRGTSNDRAMSRTSAAWSASGGDGSARWIDVGPRTALICTELAALLALPMHLGAEYRGGRAPSDGAHVVRGYPGGVFCGCIRGGCLVDWKGLLLVTAKEKFRRLIHSSTTRSIAK